MAENNNGYWTKWLVGALWFLIITALLTIGNNLIASDKESRSRDKDIENKLQECMEKQGDVNREILITLAEIKTDLTYIKKVVK